MELLQATDCTQFEDYYKLKCQEDAILWSGFRNAPDKNKLLDHYKKIISKKSNVLIFYLLDNNKIIGYAQGTILDQNSVEYSATNIFKKFQGQGYLQDLSSLFLSRMKELGFSKITGWASEKNRPAEFNLIFNKFIKTNEFEERELPLLGGKHRFYKWIKQL